MSGIELTASQQQAVDALDRTVSVSAGAGSGKTEVLVQRFCNIVATQGANVDEILTVTFTEKAAKEMKQRIVAEFGRLADETNDPRFEEARRKVESAYIGTIHSFAARLLRENAFEAGVDPRSRVLDSVEASTLRDSVLETLITDSYSEGARECLDLLSAFGKDALKSAITGLHSHAQSLGRDVDRIEVAKGEAVDVDEEIDAYVRIMDDLMAKLDEGAVGGKFVEILARARPTYESIRPAALQLKERARATLDDPVRYAREFDRDLFEEVGPAPKLIPLNVGSADIKETYTKPAKAHAERFIAGLLSPLSEHYLCCLREMTKAFREQYVSAKRNIGALDFDDLLIRTRDLLSDGRIEVADEYRRKFRYVIMDEFQDTNSLQKSIIDAVCPPDRFFSVGDVKQSIFGFQNADVNVFMEHHRKIKESPEAVDISFAENFRSRPEILGFVNWLFGQVWQEDGDFDFEELEAKSRFHETERSSVELLFVPMDGNTEQSRLAEARAIAARIRQMLGRDGGSPLLVTRMKKEGDPPRDLRPGDIMILFRSTTDIPIYERALSDAGIEYYVVSGRGFYETHEVNDLLCLLKVVDNPLDDVAMAAVLRSPLVGVADDTLWWLTRKPGTDGTESNREIGRLFDGMHDLDGLAGIDAADRARLEGFVSLLKELRGISAGSRITDLLDLALSRTSYDLKVLASEHGKQRYANVRKMLDLAQGFQANKLFHLPDFIRHIETLKVVADREGEAPTETEESPVVRLMTVHKAKGLQAPVVFVADCSRGMKTGSGGPFIFSKDLGAACKIRNIATDDCVATPAYARVSDYLRQKDISEEKRLLYVAATRAEELLVLTGISKYDGKSAEKDSYRETGSWSGWIEKALGIAERPPGGQTMLSIDGISVGLLDGTGLTDTAAGAEVRIPVTERLAQIKRIPDAAGKGVHPVVERCYAPLVRGEEAPLVLTVSRILDYLACPRMYYCRWVLGIRDEDIEPEDHIQESQGHVAPTSLGTAVHQIMRAVDFSQDLEPQFERLIGLQPEALRADAWEACHRLLGSPWADRIRSASRRLQEVPLRVRLDSCDFRGRADLLFEEDGRWVVADFKTGVGTDKERYRLQVGIYALAVQRCLGTVPAEAAIVSLGRGSGYSDRVDNALLDQAESTVRDVARNLRAEAFAPRTSRECTHCDFKAYCDSGDTTEG